MSHVPILLINHRLSDHLMARVRAAAPEMEIVSATTEEITRRWPEWRERVEIVLGRLPSSCLHDAPALRWIQATGAGVDWLVREPDIARSDLVVTNASGVHAVPISEHILALMLAFVRDLAPCIRAQLEHRWERNHHVTELEGTVMGLIGVGAIGERTAQKAKALGLHVLGVRRHPDRPSPWVDEMHGMDQLLTVLPRCDWVVITAPLTQETRGLIGERELRAMKRTAYLINIGRGAIIQEDALIQALREGWIAGAGLDVFSEEPLPPDSPLWDMPQVIITPHYAGATPRYDERLIEIFEENLRRYRRGEPMINVVDKRLGY